MLGSLGWPPMGFPIRRLLLLLPLLLWAASAPQCQPGYYPSGSPSTCQPCVGGSYGTDGSSCAYGCAPGFACPPGSASPFASLCPNGTYCPARSSATSACAAGTGGGAGLASAAECQCASPDACPGVEACTVRTLVGGGRYGDANGVGPAARFNAPTGLTMDPAGTTLYVMDKENNLVRTVALATGATATLAGWRWRQAHAGWRGAAGLLQQPL